MALSNADRQRRYRERLKSRALRNDDGETLRSVVYAICKAHWDEHGENRDNGSNPDGPQSPEAETDEMMDNLSKALEYWAFDWGLDDPDDPHHVRLMAILKNFVT